MQRLSKIRFYCPDRVKPGAAFTLIELLVVIAIIALLAAMIFPVFAQARAKAHAASCISNEKQIGLAVMQYAQDFDESFPVGGFVGRGWAGQLYSYVKNAGIFTCPGDPTWSDGKKTPISYGMNMWLVETKPARIIANQKAPAKTVMLFEVTDVTADVTDPSEFTSAIGCGGDPAGSGWIDHNGGVGSYDTGVMGIPPRSTVTFVRNKTRGRHSNGANFLLCDGHVKWFNRDQVSTGNPALLSNCPQEPTTIECGKNGYYAAGTDAAPATFSPN